MEHRDMIGAMRSATIILSDSGGVQEEAPALGVPLLVLRSKTERPEGVESGNSLLVGNDGPAIVREVRRLLADQAALRAMAIPSLPFGDGKASQRIAAHIDDWLVRQKGTRQRLIA
jgi:UDP-N-acetylglucosamine 2-epimerase (non-hydrolysing)